jgi:hypothetical protein
MIESATRVASVRRETILDWLPYVTAARLAEDVPGEQHRLVELIEAL